MTIANAKITILKHLREQCGGSFTPMLIEEHTIDAEQGCIFFYDSREFVETNNFSFAIAGNGPVAVSKHDRMIYSLTPSINTEDIVAEFSSRLAEPNN